MGLRLTQASARQSSRTCRNRELKVREVQREMTTRPLPLLLLDGPFAVCRLAVDAAVPTWATAGAFSSITRTPDELSVVCAEDAVPEGIKCERGWRCLRVAGTIEFSVVGVLASLTAPLAEAGISAFAVSTFDSDYLLVKDKDLPAALDALLGAGHVIR